VLILVIIAFDAVNDRSVIAQLFKVAGYTYGPLLGMFTFGLATKRTVNDKIIPVIAVASPFLTYGIKLLVEHTTPYRFGFELLIVNGLLTFIMLLAFSHRTKINMA